ncbi:EpsD [Pseudoalteromonas distincta]|uniref:VpsP family polysaccharide biosynthesis protein n=1 Tax=Pseudoalteromonas distincta TaxID=77608 RepID=A0ABT9GB53_9GAMM|nr:MULTISPECIES: VpsP family polysaccharide biosynthesis protein [Pseudoalteromonas distincta group]KHM46524.1 EpsD [Pseudoalteromonas elyakovii]KID34131.1 EpsD [Pseudoalteromonas distincta]MDP4483111.1 VpsP family polysaccharide biosynthesis protein [Pseudoalteromonas elyakovii]
MNNTNKLIKQVQIVVLVLITLAICFSSFQSMRANAWYFNAVNTLKGSANNYSQQNLQSAQDAINLASSLEPTHPHYLQLMAHVQMLKLAAGTDKTTDVLAIYQQVEELLLQSVALRQSWPETWVALAQVVSYQEGPSERVYEYIQQAKKVGPYKYDVQLGIIQIALINWQQLPPKYKVLFVNELKLAVKHGHKFTRAFEVAKQVEALHILCLSLKFGRHYEPIRTSWMFKKHCN